MSEYATQDLLQFIQRSPSVYHVVNNMEIILQEQGYEYISETSGWDVQKGGHYYTTRNGASLIAFQVGKQLERPHYQMAAAHTDSPTFKLKHHSMISSQQGTRVNVEKYGSLIENTWFDRPLKIAGRILVDTGKMIQPYLYESEHALCMIPSLATHLTRSTEQNESSDEFYPILSSAFVTEEEFQEFLAKEIGCQPEQIVGKDLCLVNEQEPSIWGMNREYMSSPKLDNLEGCFCALHGFLQSTNENSISVFACFDHEEIGSNTYQGAMSTFLSDTLTRIHTSLGYEQDSYYSALASSMMLSVDNAHGLHPNYVQKSDDQNHPLLNGGVVIKENARQRYATDGMTRAIFEHICRQANVPVQTYANRSGIAGGSTLGNLSNMQVSVPTVDIGLAQWAMHSIYETAGCQDVTFMIHAIQAFYDSQVEFTDQGVCLL